MKKTSVKKIHCTECVNFLLFCVSNNNAIKRTNIEIDLDLVREVMEKYQLKSMKDAINFSLENTVESIKRARLLQMKGKVTWEGNLDEMRNSVAVKPSRFLQTKSLRELRNPK